MNKYAKIFTAIFKITIGSIAILFSLGMMLAPFVVFVVSLIFPSEGFYLGFALMSGVSIVSGGYFVSYMLGWTFLGDNYRESGSYHGYSSGNGTIIAPTMETIVTRKYLIRRSIHGYVVAALCFISAIICIVFAVASQGTTLAFCIVGAIIDFIISVVMSLVWGRGSQLDIKNKNYEREN